MVLGLVGILFFGLFCGLMVVMLFNHVESRLEEPTGTVFAPETSTTSYSPTYTDGLVRLEDSDSLSTMATSNPTASPASQQTDPLLASLLQQQPPRCASPPRQGMEPLRGKKGIGLNHKNYTTIGYATRLQSLNPYWSYTWGLERPDGHPEEIEFVPMVWGDKVDEAKFRQRLMEQLWPQIQAGSVQRLLGFNEPDSKKQSNLPVYHAIEAWPDLEAVGLPLVSPACVHTDGSWMSYFMNYASQECLRVDWVAVHWYGRPDVYEFVGQITSYHHRYNLPLLITEFAPVNWTAKSREDEYSSQVVLDFMRAVIPWLEEQSWIAGYAWFPFDTMHHPGATSALFDVDGSLTALGQFYSSVHTENPDGYTEVNLESSDEDSPPASCLQYPLPPPLGGKRGLAVTRQATEQLSVMLQVIGPYWYHSWTPNPPVTQHLDDIEFIPMIHHDREDIDDILREHVVPYVQGGQIKRLLAGFQAPRNESLHVSVSQALTDWPKLEALGVPLTSPLSHDEHNDDDWLASFMSNATEGCLRVDWVGAQYDGQANFTAVRSRLESLHQQYQLPVLVVDISVREEGWGQSRTEIDCSQPDFLEFFKEVTSWLDQQDWVVGYAWASSILWNDELNLTVCGRHYITNIGSDDRQ